MYYPLLRARQFELIALRELAIDRISQNSIMPILEPVKDKFNNLNLANNIFLENGQSAFLIVNPIVGFPNGDGTEYIDYLSALTASSYSPAFRYNSNVEFIERTILQYGLTNVLLLCNNDIEAESDEFVRLVNNPAIETIVVEDPGRNRRLHRLIRDTGKTYVRLDDLFEKMPRNSEYLEIENHRFSEEHLYYDEDGFDGFSDFTVLPSEFSEGGSTPKAVVVHISYLHNANQIWIRHFTSTTNDSIANVQGKFGQAAEKAVRFCRAEGITNSAIRELTDLFEREHYPGLGTVKKISIKNHLIIVAEFLTANS